MAAPALALLDGRYQLIRQLSGPARTPLMVASDLQTGDVVCIRLQRFTTAMANLTAVPLLAPEPLPGDGPLLPRDFGVDEGTAYLVREFVTATSLQQLLDEPALPTPLEVVTILRRAGDALLAATEQGFSHPGLALRHLLVTANGNVRVSGYDQLQRGRTRAGAREGEMLALLILEALASAGGAVPIGTVRTATTAAAAAKPARAAPASLWASAAGGSNSALRALLLRCQTWHSTSAPSLEAVVRHLRQCEEQMLGHSRLGEAWRKSSHITAALFHRFRHLGPLLHPYFAVLALVTAIIVFATHTLSSPAHPGRLLVYPIPTRASNDVTNSYFFASPPQVMVTTTATVSIATVTTATPPAATIIPRTEVPGATTATGTMPARRVAPVATARRVRPAPQAPLQRTIRQVPATAPAQAAVKRSVATTPAQPGAAPSQAVAAQAGSTVIVTKLTAQQTTARVTVIAATSEASKTSVFLTAHPTTTTSTQVTTASALHLAPAATRAVATTTVSKATAAVASSAVTKQVAVLR